jgi:hypothetical protein
MECMDMIEEEIIALVTQEKVLIRRITLLGTYRTNINKVEFPVLASFAHFIPRASSPSYKDFSHL